MSQVDHAYCELLLPLLNQTQSAIRPDRTGTGTYSMFAPRPLRLDISSEFPLLTLKKIPYRHVVEELLWFLRGSTNVKSLQEKGVTIWDEWAREDGNLGRVYGAQWRCFAGVYSSRLEALMETDYLASRPKNFGLVDQISEVMREARKNPTSRRLFVSAWNPADIRYDFIALLPCHVSFQLYLEPSDDPNQRLISMHVYMRSCDVFLGLPFNIASYATLTHLMGYVLGYKPHVLTFSFGDLHLYSNHVAQAQLLLSRLPQELPAPTLQIHPTFRPDTALDNMRNLYGWEYRDFKLTGYDPHPAIPAEVAV